MIPYVRSSKVPSLTRTGYMQWSPWLPVPLPPPSAIASQQLVHDFFRHRRVRRYPGHIRVLPIEVMDLTLPERRKDGAAVPFLRLEMIEGRVSSAESVPRRNAAIRRGLSGSVGLAALVYFLAAYAQ